MRDDREHSVRAWLLYVEQMWNAGDLRGCLDCLHPDLVVQRRQRSFRYPHLARWLRSCFSLNADSQIRLVIERIELQTDTARVMLHIHCRCIRSMQLEERHLRATLKLISNRTNTWLVREIEV
ncbi:MAG: hypothetical protein JNJ61_05670 [Anaerolineae bacterium]|nr:hypothetical protein [Anaerolineae bacterium]